MGEEKERGSDRLQIWLMVEHGPPEISNSIYKIEPPSDLSSSEVEDGDGFMVNQMEKTPYFTVEEKNKTLITGTQMVKLGSKLYFLGGVRVSDLTTEKKRQVLKIDLEDRYQPRLQSVKPMLHPKSRPCVFTVDGKIYALSEQDGNFECYDPELHKWEELPKAPHPLYRVRAYDWSNCATVIGRDVYIAYGDKCMVYDSKSGKWNPELQPAQFPCGDTIYSNGSLYYLWGVGVHRPGTAVPFQLTGVGHPLRIIKKDYFNGAEQVMVEESELDKNKFYTEHDFRPWRKLFHLYDNFFCYVLTTLLVEDTLRPTPPVPLDILIDDHSRAVFINVFEEVFDPDNTNKSFFRSLASFSYKFTTDFRGHAQLVCGSASGTLPDSWIKA